MSCITRYFCDECESEMSRPEIQWSACQENGWRTLDFCGRPCAERRRLRANEIVKRICGGKQ